MMVSLVILIFLGFIRLEMDQKEIDDYKIKSLERG